MDGLHSAGLNPLVLYFCFDLYIGGGKVGRWRRVLCVSLRVFTPSASFSVHLPSRSASDSAPRFNSSL